MVEKLLQGNREFQGKFCRENAELMGKLARGQSPKTLFIGCSDSRVVPELITSCLPGDIFVTRNIANIVGKGSNCVDAIVEYAVNHLKVGNIIVCGHYGCGGMAGLCKLGHLEKNLQDWLRPSLEAKEKLDSAIKEKGIELNGDDYAKALVEANILLQLRNLRESEILAGKNVNLVGLVYDIESGRLFEGMEKLKELGVDGEIFS
ncbi:MAG: carbonic anhydrase [Candidatus Diapherotrites archaeon]